MTQEATFEEGTVTYTPDKAGRRTSMTVTTESTAQPVINYNYDAADKLTSVSQNGSQQPRLTPTRRGGSKP